MIRINFLGALVTAAMLLAGCDGNGGGTVVSPTPTPTPPAPTPTPTTTPTPSPTPALTYVPFDQTSVDTTFYALHVYRQQSSTNLSDREWPGGFGFIYHAATQSFETSGRRLFTPAEIVTQNADLVAYQEPGPVPSNSDPAYPRSLTFYIPLIDSARLFYVRPFRRTDIFGQPPVNPNNPVMVYGVTGVPTLTADILTGSATYKLRIYGMVGFDGYDLSTSTGTVSLNSAATTATVHLELIGIPAGGGAAVNFGTLDGTSTLQPDKMFWGDWSNSTVGGTPARDGRFQGMFFGPHGNEIGLAFGVRSSNGVVAMGSAGGRQQ